MKLEMLLRIADALINFNEEIMSQDCDFFCSEIAGNSTVIEQEQSHMNLIIPMKQRGGVGH
jgi:hypothetical protein